jgi:hypothetical protein
MHVLALDFFGRLFGRTPLQSGIDEVMSTGKSMSMRSILEGVGTAG